MTIYREEIFGPVLSILPFEDEEHAIAMANDTEYGLTNYIQTSDPEKLRRVARRVRSGMVEGNGKGFAQGSPFGGFKQSGNGREGGVFRPARVPRDQGGLRLGVRASAPPRAPGSGSRSSARVEALPPHLRSFPPG
jgi:delta 1-pyrroline-5-carboxylate dehydrogenase